MDFERSIHKLATILSEDEPATRKMEMIYNQLDLTKADLIGIRTTVAMEGGLSYNLFSKMLSKWHGKLGATATVERFVTELSEVNELQNCIAKIRTKFNLLPPPPSNTTEGTATISQNILPTDVEDFTMSRIQCNRVRQIILNDHDQVLKNWQEIKDEFLQNGADIFDISEMIRRREPIADTISETFARWIEKTSQSSKATFNSLTAIFEKKGYTRLSATLKEKMVEIRG